MQLQKAQGDVGFGLAVEQNISLSEIPLVGHALANIEKLSVSNFQFLIASKIIPASMAGKLSSLIKDSTLKLPTTDIPAGLSFSSTLSWGSNSRIRGRAQLRRASR